MERANLFALEATFDETDPDGYRAGMARFGPHIGASMLGGTVYPDSDKIGIWPGDARDNILVRRESGVDYWDRET